MTCKLDDDEADIEAEIQRELDALGDDSLHIEDVEDEHLTLKTNETKEDSLPDSIQEYLRLLHSRTEGAEEEVKECEIILEKLPPDSLVKEDEQLLARRIKEELGDEYKENALVLRDQVLSQLEEVELREEKEKLRAENKNADDNEFALDIIRPGVIEEIQALEEKAQKKLKELEEKQAGKDQEREKWYQERRKEEEERQEREKDARLRRQKEFEAAQKSLLKQQEALKAKLELEAREEERKLKEMEEKFQVEIRAIEEERRKQSKAFVEAQQKEAEYQLTKQGNAAAKIQKCYRGFRVRKQYQPLLQAKREERARKRREELDRIERVEKTLREEAERKKLEDEQKRKEENEKRKKQEEEKRKQEEAEKERKLKEEERIREEEKRKKVEEDRNRLVEEEKRKKEEEVRKKREEEDKRRKEELQRKMEEEKRKAEEEERNKREEEQKLREEEMKRKIEEEKRQDEEARRKKEKDEKEKRKAEDKRRKQEKEKKLREDELKRKMDEEKRIADEENRRQQQEEKIRNELLVKRKEEEQKRREEEEKQKEDKRKKKEAESELQEERKRMVKEEEYIRKDELNTGEAKMKTSQTKEITKEPREKSATCDEQEQERKASNDLKQNEITAPGLTLTKDLETRRLQWVTEHTPWSTTLTTEERSHPVAMKTKPRRAFSATKHLPALTEAQLLKSSPANTPLFRVKCVALKDEPSLSMQGLSKCPELRSLSLQNCGLLAVEGLEKCKELQELRVEGNKIEVTNCRDLPKLEHVSLANNNLASVHGLQGCNGVMSLDLGNNKITRIGDLSSCSRLQKLIMDNNQLINTKGLSCLKHLQHLSLAHNHLARISEIEKCMLLQTLNLQANNLQEPPHLTNCVLLRELRLDDNSISSLDSLSTAWLPLLQLLSVSQNSISQLASLGNLIMLESLDISNNLISDTNSLIPGLQGCCRLKTLTIEGNPVHEDPDCRTLIVQALPDLRSLDGEIFPGEGKVTVTNQAAFIHMCLNQLQSQDDLKSRRKKERSDTQASHPDLVAKRLDLMSQHNKERFELSVKHLQEHENFSLDNYQPAVTDETSQECNRNLEKTTELRDNLNADQRGKQSRSLDPQKQRHIAATKIQALWRGWYIRHLIGVNTTKWLAAVCIQSAWRGYLVRSRLKRESREPWDPQRNSAATVIQAHFRGQRVRRRLAEALKAAQFYDNGDDEDFDYEEEVDLTAFDFDETLLEQGWTPTDTPQLPARGPVLRLPGQSSKTLKSGSRGDVSNKPAVPKPRHAWRSAASPMTDVNQAPFGKENKDHDEVSVTSGAQSHLSHRAEELSSEWGFRSSETAELMMRRAKKMKYNPARRKKLLDPNERLALFKKLEETNKLREVRPPPTRRQPPKRVDYFAAREAMTSHVTSTSPTSEQRNREQMTYSWVYRQAVVHEDEEKNIMADRKEYAPDNKTKKTSPQKSNRSPVNLPHMDPVVLSGRTLPLISSPLFSESLEQTSLEGPSPRRNSLSSARSTAGGDQPIKTEKSNSAGARINREPRNKR